MEKNQILRTIPKVDEILKLLDSNEPINIKFTRRILDELRQSVLAGEISEIPSVDVILRRIKDAAMVGVKRGLTRVINATGIVLHTNLGRAPMSYEVAERVKQAALGYCSLEYDLDCGRRGSRTKAVEELFVEICGCEAAACVNNNAAAVLLSLSALCAKGEVIVSRGEMVEIGGSFRVPEIISQGGAVLVEVGATNKTSLLDYKTKLTAQTAAILKVHTSNYRILGYTQDVEIFELAKLAFESNIPLIYDLGGGALIKLSSFEPTVQEVLKQGASLVCFSGDKLLGGPQAGIILGKKDYIDKIVKHPLYRAMRLDKLSLAALEATLLLYQNQIHKIPTLNMLTISEKNLQSKANKLLQMISDENIPMITTKITQTVGQAGGGSLPGEEFPSWAIAVTVKDGLTLQTIEKTLRTWRIPIIARIHKEKMLFDVRTIEEEDFIEITMAMQSLFI